MATTQLIIHFERLLRIKIEIPFGVIFSRYSSVELKELSVPLCDIIKAVSWKSLFQATW